jgi:hypothetical protein
LLEERLDEVGRSSLLAAPLYGQLVEVCLASGDRASLELDDAEPRNRSRIRSERLSPVDGAPAATIAAWLHEKDPWGGG